MSKKIKLFSDVLTDEQRARVVSQIAKEKAIRPITEYGMTAPEVPVENDVKIYRQQGRLDLERIFLDQDIQERFDALAKEYNPDYELIPDGIMWAEYDGSIGSNPFLGPHYDGGNCDFMIDYQIKSNTDWAIGQNETVTDMKDNQAVSLFPLSYMHYRPKKQFAKDEYVIAMFMRYTAKTPDVPERDDSPGLEDRVKEIWNTYYGI